MELDEILALYDLEERREAIVSGMRTERDGPVVRLVAQGEDIKTSYVIYSDLDEANAVEHIARQIAYFKELRQSFEWKTFAHDGPAGLGARLAAQGFEADETEALLVLDLLQAPPRLLSPITADVRLLEDPAGLQSVRRLLETVWESDFAWFPARMGSTMNEDMAAIYLAYESGEPASAAWVFFSQNSHFAGMYGGSTLPQFRGRGLYTALVAARAQEAIRRGYRFLTIDAGEMSRPIVERLGFQLLTMTTPYTMMMGDEA